MSVVASSYTFANDAGQNVYVHTWAPPGAVRGAVVVAHGMAEHGGRYARFAEILTKNGLFVAAPDHRGHGKTSPDSLGWGGPDAWNGMLRDLGVVVDRAASEHPGYPVFLFGHSMGSVLAQRFMQKRGSALHGTILSGTTSVLPGADQLVPFVRSQAQGEAARQPSPLATTLFASFNAAFEPARTPFDWLSRDEAEVQKYLDDPLCGFAFTNGLLADELAGFVETWLPENERRIPPDLAILNIAGAVDPVGGAGEYVRALTERYGAIGIEHVETVLYPEARHEILNETNRDDVHTDIIAWLNALL